MALHMFGRSKFKVLHRQHGFHFRTRDKLTSDGDRTSHKMVEDSLDKQFKGKAIKWPRLMKLYASLLFLTALSYAQGQIVEVCFSPEGICDQSLLSLIRGAQEQLDIAIYDINLPEVADAIIDKSHTIPVRVLVDKLQSHEKNSLVSYLSGARVNMRYGHQEGSGIMHMKVTLVDGSRFSTGSYNYTKHATQFNNENLIIIDDVDTERRYLSKFDQMWEKGEAIP